MAHVFRLHTGGTQNLDGWDNSKQYGQNEINNIIDPSGAAAALPITSVPTPFASLELARNAFDLCGSVGSNGQGNISGDTIYHKIVSFALDVLEIFFNFKKFSADYEIIPWDVQKEIAQLLASPAEEHRKLGQTLQLYVSQDAEAFNFAEGTVFYLLNYRRGPAPLNIVGATSTTSLAVASANDMSYVDTPLSGNHRAFDPDKRSFRSLAERDGMFIKYVWTLAMQPQFCNLYPEVYKYVQECFRNITDMQLKEELRTVQPADIEAYDELVAGAARVCLPGNVALRLCEIPDPGKLSDFTILSDYGESDGLPLVLPFQTGYNEPSMRYVSGPWNPSLKAPCYDSLPLDKRRLPGDSTVYPYLTVDDVFQPYIIKTTFPIEENSYFSGNYKADGGFSYLLPLKKTLFNYLRLSTICGTTKGAHVLNIFEMNDIAGGGVEAVVRIPVRGGRYITMRRRYYDTDDEPKVQENRGVIVQCTFDMYLFPSFHFKGGDRATASPQRIYLADGDWKELTKHYDYTVEAYSESDAFAQNRIKTVIQRADKNRNASISSKIFAARDEFDLIKISNGFAEGMLVPKYSTVSEGTDVYSFAIDFGTTNTHVEYRLNGSNNVMPLTLTGSERAVIAMHPIDGRYEQMFFEKTLNAFIEAPYQEFVPVEIGGASMAAFPLRTNICFQRVAGDADGVQNKLTLGDYAIGFNYEKTNTYGYNRTVTNLKWLGDGTQKYVSGFFEELLMIIRAKVLLGGGSLKSTSITWFYPVSMETFRRSQLKREWERLCAELISPECAVRSVTESLAPFYYYKNVEGVNAACRPVVLMDIGGGTTDFAVYEHNSPALVSSVRFAGNSVYGDFPGFGASMNGFVNRYREMFAKSIKNTGKSSLVSAYNNVVESGVSADFVSFLYSLERNTELLKSDMSISFTETLRTDYPMKTALLLFYVAEIYYLAHLLKDKGIATPEYLTVSGTGSKLLDIIGGMSEMEKLARIVFNDVIGDDGKVSVRQVPNPKEITCKGGLLMKDGDNVADSDGLRYWFAASESIGAKGCRIKLKDIDAKTESEVVDFYKTFVDYFFGLNKKFPFDKNFGINTQNMFAEYRDLLLEHAGEDFAAMLETRRDESNDPDVELEDSMFFFPLAGGIDRLLYFISTQK